MKNQERTEKPSYYSILPAAIRYDKELKANEKLLYSEITALSSKTGECWASNAYFAELYEVSPSTVSEWVNHLKTKGYITIHYEFKDGTKCIEKRVIHLAETEVFIKNEKVFGNNEKVFINNEKVFGNAEEVFINSEEGYSEKTEGVFRNPEEGYSEKPKDNTINLNTKNTNNINPNTTIVSTKVYSIESSTNTPTGVKETKVLERPKDEQDAIDFISTLDLSKEYRNKLFKIAKYNKWNLENLQKEWKRVSDFSQDIQYYSIDFTINHKFPRIKLEYEPQQ